MESKVQQDRLVQQAHLDLVVKQVMLETEVLKEKLVLLAVLDLRDRLEKEDSLGLRDQLDQLVLKEKREVKEQLGQLDHLEDLAVLVKEDLVAQLVLLAQQGQLVNGELREREETVVKQETLVHLELKG